MYGLSSKKKCLFQRGGHCGEVTISGGLTALQLVKSLPFRIPEAWYMCLFCAKPLLPVQAFYNWEYLPDHRQPKLSMRVKTFGVILHNSQMAVNIKDMYENSGNRSKKINTSTRAVNKGRLVSPPQPATFISFCHY